MSSLTADKDNEESKQQELLDKISAILRDIDPDNEAELSAEFVSYKVHKCPILDKIVSLVFNMAVQRPRCCEIYARLCFAETENELTSCGDAIVVQSSIASKFREALLKFAHDVFDTRNAEEAVSKEIDEEPDLQRKDEIRIEKTNQYRREMFGNAKFLGHLYNLDVMPLGIIDFAVFKLLETVTCGSLMEGHHVDQEAVECAAELLEITGSALDAREDERDQSPEQPPNARMDHAFALIEGAMTLVGKEVKRKIQKLIILRENGWVAEADEDREQYEQATEIRILRAENDQLRRAVNGMQDAMFELRRAMANLEQRNKAILDLIGRHS